MQKLMPFFDGKTLTITQSPHGNAQSKQAIDCVSRSGTGIYAPCDVKVGAQQYDKAGNPFFEVFNNNFKIQFVHCLVKVKPGVYAAGTRIGVWTFAGDKYPDHMHVAIKVSNKWYCILDFLDRSLKLKVGAGFKSTHWQNWSTWPDRKLVILELVKREPAPPKNVYLVGQKKIKTRDDAFDYWHSDKKQQVFYNGNNITSEFRSMATKLENEIAKLVKARDLSESLLKKAKTDNQLLAERVDELEIRIAKYKNIEKEITALAKQNTELANEKRQLTADLRNISSSFFGQLYFIFNRSEQRRHR